MNTKATELINAVGAMVIEEKQFLTDLDAAIGDGDHGINMARGFEAVKTKLAGAPEGDVGAALKLVGMTLISTVGGAAGPLYGTAFLRAAGAAQGKELVDEEIPFIEGEDELLDEELGDLDLDDLDEGKEP